MPCSACANARRRTKPYTPLSSKSDAKAKAAARQEAARQEAVRQPSTYLARHTSLAIGMFVARPSQQSYALDFQTTYTNTNKTPNTQHTNTNQS